MSGTNVLYFTTTGTDGSYPNALWETDGTPGGTHLIANYPAGVVVQPLEVVDGDLLYGVGTSTGIELFLNQGTVGMQEFLTDDSGPLNSGTLSNYLEFLSGTDVLIETTSSAAAGSNTIAHAEDDVVTLDYAPPSLAEGFYLDGIERSSLYKEAEAYQNNFGTYLPIQELGLALYSSFHRSVSPGQSSISQSLTHSFFVQSSQSTGADFLFAGNNSNGTAALYIGDFTTQTPVLIATAAAFSAQGGAGSAALGGRVFLAEAATGTPAASLDELIAVADADTAPTVIYNFGSGTSIVSISVSAATLFIDVTNADGTNSLWTQDGSNDVPALVANLGTAVPIQLQDTGDGTGRVFFQLGHEIAVASAGGVTILGTFAEIGTLFAANGTLWFGAAQTGQTIQLWTSDGTAAGTSLAATINPTGDADPTNFQAFGDGVAFSATDGTDGTQLWTWNGTTANMVTDMAAGSGGIDAHFLLPGTATATQTAGSGLVTFNALNWAGTTSYGSSDGTAADTSVIAGMENRPGVYSISAGAGTLKISHGTAATTVTVLIAPEGTNFYGFSPPVATLSAAPNGTFFQYTTLNTTTFDVSSTIGYIAETSLTPITLRTFAPTIAEGLTSIGDELETATGEYFVVEFTDGDYRSQSSQLWQTDGTQADTVMIANLGSVYDPGTNNGGTYNAAADSQIWGALLEADTGGAISLFTSTGSVSNLSTVALASLGLSGAIDNTGQNSLGLIGTTFLFSVTNGTSIEAVAADGTTGTVLIAETRVGGQVFGDFTRSGNLIYFDDGAGGALYVSDGTAANTKQLLSSGALIGPAATSVELPATASIAVGNITYFYFVATRNGETGLYYTDGDTVTTVLASGLTQSGAYLTASGGSIFFAADDGTGVTTLWSTAAGTATASMVIGPTLYASTLLQGTFFGEPTDVTAIQAGAAYPDAPDTFFLTSGTDTIAGRAGDTSIYASPGDLSAGDQIDGGAGINDLYLSGTGAFDLSAPATLNNITQVLISATDSTIDLRNGTTLLVEDSGSGNTIAGAADSDTITTAGTVVVGAATETITEAARAVITSATEGATITAQVLEVAGGGNVELGSSVSNVATVTLDVATNLTVDIPGASLAIEGSSGTDTITVGDTGGVDLPTFVTIAGNGGGDDIVLNNSATVFAKIVDTAADLNGITIQGFNFAPRAGLADAIDITNFAFSTAETAVYNNGTLTVTNGGTQTAITIPGAPAGGGFLLSADSGSGTTVQYIAQLYTLTPGNDSVTGTATNQIDAATATMTSGDIVNGGATGVYGAFTSTLQLIGAGDFDLSAPAALTGITTVQGDMTGSNAGASDAVAQTITLRAGMNTPVVLGSGHDTVYGAANGATITSSPENPAAGGDTIYAGSAREVVQLSGGASDVIHVTAASGLARVSDSLGGFLATGTEDVDGGGIAGLGNVSVGEVLLTAPTRLYAVDTAPGDITGSTGQDLIDLTNVGATSFGGAITVFPNGGGDEVLAPINDSLVVKGSESQLNDTTIVAFNFLPAAQSSAYDGLTTPDKIDITNLPTSAVTTSFLGGTLSVLNNGVTVDTFSLPGSPAAGNFVATTDGATGTLLNFNPGSAAVTVNATLSASQTSFAASPGDDKLSVPLGAFTAAQALDGDGGVNTLSLTSAGTYDLSVPTALADFQVLDVASGATVKLRPGDPMDIVDGGGTIAGANTGDPIVLDQSSNNAINPNTVVVGNPAATVIDDGVNTTYSVTATTIGATIEGPRDGSGTLAVTGAGGAVMGNNIQGVSAVDLTRTGAVFQANASPDLAISLSGGPGGTPDIVVSGPGGDTITDTSSGDNILAAGEGGDTFVFGSVAQSIIPAQDTLYDFDASGSDTIEIPGLFTSSVSFDNGTLTVGAGDPRQLQLILSGTYTGQFTANPSTLSAIGTTVTFAGTVAAGSGGPAIGGSAAHQTITDRTTIAPFSNVTIADGNSGQTEALTVTLSTPADGTLSNLSGGSYNIATGVYNDTGAAAAMTAALNGLVFTPTAHQIGLGQTVATVFTITDIDTAGAVATDSTTTVDAVAVGPRTLVWTGVQNTNFANAANWDDLTDSLNPAETAPDATDTVEFNSSGNAIAGTGTAAAMDVGSTGDGALQLSGGASLVTGSLDAGVLASAVGQIGLSGVGTGLTVTGGATVADAGTGVLSVLSGATFSAGGLTIGANKGSSGAVVVSGAGSDLVVSGVLNIGSALGAGDLTVGPSAAVHASVINLEGQVVLEAGLLDPSVTVINPNKSLGGSGTVASGDIIDEGILQAGDGTPGQLELVRGIIAGGGTLTENGGKVSNKANAVGVLQINTFGTMEVDGAVLNAKTTSFANDVTPTTTYAVTNSVIDVNFEDSTGVLQLDDIAGFGGTIATFQVGDRFIITAGTLSGLGVNNSSTLTMTDAGNGGTDQIIFGSPVSASYFNIVAGNTIDVVACFAAGTRVATAGGLVTVESLRTGDRVITVDGGHEPIVWIGRRAVNCEAHPAPETLWPVRVSAGAFGENVPVRDLYLSPDHAVFVNGALVPVKLLIGGAGIAQVKRSGVTYYHVELPAHAVILAEGLPVESYLDTGDRANFGDGTTIRLFRDFVKRFAPDAAMAWEAKAAAPLVMTGEALGAARHALMKCASRLRSLSVEAISRDG